MTENSWTTTIGAAANVVSANEQQPPSTTAASIDVSSTLASVTEAIKSLISSTTTEASNSDAASTPFSSEMNDATTTTTAANRPTVGDLSSSLQHFGIVDYCVFVLMLVVCAVIGFYFGFIEKKSKKRDGEQRRGSEALDYLVGGRKMKVFPVSLSLVASFVSGISLLGTSTEIYVYGTQYAFILITLVISGFISWYVFLPVFCNLQLTSTYEYFEMRFDRRIRYFGSVLFIVGMILYLPVAIYVPALTFNQVTGINIHIITPIVCIVCTFYTCVGGLKAVIWTDVIQSFVMYGSILAVCIKGTLDVGGLGVVLERNEASGRLNAPDITWDPTVRLSMLSVLIGSTLHKIQSSDVNQISIQRFLSLPTLKKVKQTMILFTILLIFLLSCCCYMGLVTYATYHDCDPLSTRLARASDQLPSLLMMRTLGGFPGAAGLFVAGVFSAALSSLSTGLNSLACVISQDVVKPLLPSPLSERGTAILLRFIVVFFGIGCIALVLVVEKLGMVLELSTMTSAVSMGPLLGVYIMGVGLPWINGKSAFAGSIVSFLTISWICANAQVAKVRGEIKYPKMPVSVEGCTYNFNHTRMWSETVDYAPSVERNIYHLSFLWYTALGGVICIIFAGLASFVFGANKLDDINPKLLSPLWHKYLEKRTYKSVDFKDDDEKEKSEKAAKDCDEYFENISLK